MRVTLRVEILLGLDMRKVVVLQVNILHILRMA